MTVLAVLLDPILPVFAILAFGFVLGRTGRASVESARVLNRFAMTVLIPIVVFDLLASAPLHAFAARPMLLYAGLEAAIFAAGYAVLRRGLGIGPGESVVLAFAGIFANNVFYGLPIALLLHGEGAAVLPVTMIVVLDSTVAFGGTMIVLQLIRDGRISLPALGAIVLRTPALLAILAGLAVAALRLPLPGPVQTFLAFNGAAAAPVALFAMGVVLSETRFAADPAVALATGVKLLVFPAAVALALPAFAGGWEATRLFAFASAGPTGTMAFSLALLHGVSTGRVAQVTVWTSLLTLGTLALLA